MIKVPKWVGISGSWRSTSPEIEQEVRDAVKSIILAGNGIVTGGALNVDYQATDEVLKLGHPHQLKIFLPTSLDIYATHYRRRAQEGVITPDQATLLIAQLTKVKQLNPAGFVEHPTNTVMDETTYYERNLAVVNASDELLAFQVNNGAGTQDAIDKARAKGIPVKVYSYNIPQ